jgi:hypothetical protein
MFRRTIRLLGDEDLRMLGKYLEEILSMLREKEGQNQ